MGEQWGEEYYRALIENAHDVITILNADGTIRYISPSNEALSGYTPEELRGVKPLGHIHPDDASTAARIFAELLECPGRTREIQYRIRSKHEGWRHVQAVGTNLLDHPAIRGIVINSRDLTELKRTEDDLRTHQAELETQNEELRMAQQELEESRDLYADLYDFAPLGYASFDAAGIIREINLTGAAMLSRERGNLIGRPFVNHVAGEDHALLRNHLRSCREAGARVVTELRLDVPGRRVMHVELVTIPGMAHRDAPTIFRTSISDVTERKRTMERLEQLNRCFLDLGTDPRENVEKVLRVGREVLDAHLFKYCCTWRKTQYRCSRSGVSSTPLPPEAEGCGFLAAPPGEGPVFIPDLTLSPPWSRHPDVARFGLRSLLAVPVQAEQDTFGSLCLFSQAEREFATEERELLLMLARAVAIEEERYRHEESLRDFIDIASHELRHPITIMKGYSLILKEHGERVDDGTRNVIIDIIDHGADRLNNLVGGLLDISRIERGKFEIRREEQSLVPLIERAVQEMGARGFCNDFTRRLSGQLGQGSVDGERFVELMVLLLENAVKYSPPGSPIEVEAGETGEGTLVSILDRGMGIPEQDREHVFERFFQVEEVMHHSTPGMGMGLYIARSVVEAHGGRVWCEPREGGGTALRFVVPGGTREEEQHAG